MGTIKDRMDLTEEEDIKKWQEYTEELHTHTHTHAHTHTHKDLMTRITKMA